MIFQHTLLQVLSGNKWQTRRVISPHDEAVRGRYNRIEAVRHNGRLKWAVGRTYAVQPGRGKPQVARVRVTQIRSEHITRISTADAIAEGFSSRQAFLRAWTEIHGEDGLSYRVWIVKFELIGKCDDAEKTIHFPLSMAGVAYAH